MNKGFLRFIFLVLFSAVSVFFVSFVEAAENDKAAYPPSEQTAQKETGYWLSKTGKRHNSSCRYYKCKGRPCSKDEGVACKVCKG